MFGYEVKATMGTTANAVYDATMTVASHVIPGVNTAIAKFDEYGSKFIDVVTSHQSMRVYFTIALCILKFAVAVYLAGKYCGKVYYADESWKVIVYRDIKTTATRSYVKLSPVVSRVVDNVDAELQYVYDVVGLHMEALVTGV